MVNNRMFFMVVLGLILGYGCATFDRTDKALLIANYTMIAADTYQTRHIIDSDRFYETNSMIGEDKDQLYRYTIARSILIIGIAKAIPSSKWRKIFLAFCCGQTVEDISNNYRIGVR